MYTVQFSFDLGDYSAIYTGRIVGQIGDTFKVTYFEPRLRELLSIDLHRDQIQGRGYQELRMLPLQPVIIDNQTQPAYA